ncbi:epidermal growth factor receptor substrate 15-like 1 isoform X2 [Sitodiplosis mosellana]|uniref:epidermal growth factor receptor substrate 15-like 1 isoform X2 n=1 Tax=Sitodiplosis mosellana TaxID=263140 RepID=UPI00244525BB|nr:epidermal growth factor receptor substrate 15-like 1 isoform X2 [Sitodiplosis mosellana]
MASTLPSPTKVSGKHNPIYEAYYKQVDPKGTGAIEALAAAKFLKKSGLSDVVLSRIWDLSDPTGKGYLDKAGLFVALKLVALAQTGDTINMTNIFNEPPNPPKVGEIPKIVTPKIQSVPSTNDDWSIKPVDKLKYEELFESLQPSNGLLPGNKVRSVLMDSKLPLDALSKIWDLADQDRDGSLDKHEFIVAMHLVYLALDKRAIPQTLPVELQQRSVGKVGAPSSDNFVANFDVANIGPPPVPPLPAMLSNVPPAIPPMPQQISGRQNSVPSLLGSPPLSSSLLPSSVDWVVTPADRARYDIIFAKSDLDKDGLVSGGEIKGVFMQSGIPQMCLAQIWALCDTNQSGKLTSEQFAMAMWFVERKKNGFEPPNVLAPNMIPPSLREASNIGNLIGDTMPVGNIAPIQQPPPIEPQRQVYTNPELEMISKEIEELAKERRQLESELVQKEADIRIKNGEVRNLQSELDTLIATLKQLENQKGEAQKRLNDLKAQVAKIREQCQKQEETIREQETELDSKRGELQKLKDEESSLERDYEENKQKLDKLSKTLQETQLQICQIKALVMQLEESQRQLNDALVVCKSAIEANDPSQASYFSLKIEPDFREAKKALEAKPEPTADPFNDKAHSFSNGTDNEFRTNQFATTFDENSSGFSGFDDGFGSSFVQKSNDPFTANSTQDPFGDKKGVNTVAQDPNKDDFGSDPFAILHAPTSASQIPSPGSNLGMKTVAPPRPESPSPALPPKKAKPPRPAPPRPAPMQGPTIGKQDASGFGNSGSGFANFADFDNKNCGLTDFAEDPFKDYRYEDPFNIEDPFADTQDLSKKTLSKKASDQINANVSIGSGEFDRTETINGNGGDSNNKNAAVDNFANFDAFSSLTNDSDHFANIEFSSTQIKNL